MHAEALERRAHVLEHQLDAAPRQLVGVGIGRALDPLGELAHVVALVAVLGRLLAARARAWIDSPKRRTWLPGSFT